ncbi:unnamed protein product, partial [Symbiodinium microadriaticum]
ASSDLISLNSVLKALSAERLWRKVLELLSTPPGSRLAADIISFNTSIASCGNQWPRAVRLMKAMRDSAVIADTISINSSMSA